MSLMIRGFTTGGVEVEHIRPEGSHRGVIPWAELRRQKIGDRDDDRYLILDCPEADCDTVSTVPIGGGSQPELGQRLHLHAMKGRFGGVPRAKWTRAKGEAKRFLRELGEPEGRFLLDDADEDDLLTDAPLKPGRAAR